MWLHRLQERLLEQLEKRTGKMTNLKQETERIAAKEVDGLSEGQQRQVERNASRLNELMEQINRCEGTMEPPASPHGTAP